MKTLSGVMGLKPVKIGNWFVQDHKSLRNAILKGRKLPPIGTAFTLPQLESPKYNYEGR